ncbi:methyl-accepting chemotaxis protein [Halorhodospira halophila]|uniref:Methyl-accepting chemotaxis sensory transducer n=1 Tax=Halorhodospira halophila (strain DSM 244 / SL1) TaxID=349124 RepID=A1WTE9_HALHL|nr:methyl-accepting chemotaxis protein [Halorhodospira halophila]ABM60961.1 methyl-accepting chemotaxis sensory transducer [Halorhodospira halophila SL1]MBK1728619.1 hypothetical protein [Halorhodospira halophila]
MLANWPVRYKLGISFGLIVILMGTSGLLSHWALQDTANENRDAMAYMEQSAMLVEREVEHLSWTNELADSFLLEETFTGELDFTSCAFGEWFYDYQGSEHYESASEALREAVDGLEQPHIALHEVGERIVELQEAGRFDEAEAFYHEEAQPIRRVFQDQLGELREILEAERDRHAKQAAAQQTQAAQITVGSLAITVLFAIGLAALVSRHLTARLRSAVDSLEDIAAGDGDLTRRLDAEGRDEIAELSAAYNRFVDKIHEMVRVVRDSATQMASATEQLQRSAEEDQQGVQNQQERTSEVATAMNEMSASINEIARNTQDTANAAGDASQQSRQGQEGVGHTIETIHDLATNVRDSAEAIRALDEQSARIGQVLEVIRGIADQTNLLALNAAIEAARAGESGRGFTVVAEEVRKLAQKTQDSIGSIQEMVEGIQNGTQQAVQAMERNRQQAEGTVEEASAAGNTLQEITRVVTQIEDMTNQVASAVEQQSQVAEEVNRNLTLISDTAEQTRSSVQDTGQVSQRLAQLAEDLRDQVGRFRV